MAKLQAAENDRSYLDPAVLARIGSLELRARLLVQGFISGMHHSPLHGFSVEFAEHRKYCQGDDLRFLDWKVYGRSDKHYIKEYEQETNLQLLLAVDTSESMNYRSAGSPMTKRDYAVTIAAALAYLALQQADAVGLATFDSTIRRSIRASNHPGQWKFVIQGLTHGEGGGPTAFRSVLDKIAESHHDRHLVVVLSDLFGPPDEIIAGLKHLRHCRHEPIVLHVLDHAERTFPFDRPTQFDGLEGIDPIRTEPRVLRDHYLAALESFLHRLRRGCHGHRIDYELLDTTEPVAPALSGYLCTRAARTRRRA